MKFAVLLAMALALGASPALLAQSDRGAAQSTTLTDGEIRRVDKEAKKLTIKHGPIKNLDMPAMTMVFQVKDPKLLDQVKAGDKVRFRAEKEGDAYLVTRIEHAQ